MDETGKALATIVTQVVEITAIVGEIAAGTQEQATALQEVNTAITQMDQMTQQNAAMVEQSTAASHGLRQETEGLARLISTFRIGQDAVGVRTAEHRAADRPRTGVPKLRVIGRAEAVPRSEPQTQTEGWVGF